MCTLQRPYRMNSANGTQRDTRTDTDETPTSLPRRPAAPSRHAGVEPACSSERAACVHASLHAQRPSRAIPRACMHEHPSCCQGCVLLRDTMGTTEIPEGLRRGWVGRCLGTARILGVGRGWAGSAEFDNGGMGGPPILADYKSVFICSVYSMGMGSLQFATSKSSWDPIGN